MHTVLTFLTFDEWVKHVFEHKVDEQAWYWDLDVPEWKAPSKLSVQYLTALFGNPLPTLAPYSNAQLNQVFWYLIMPACSNYMLAVTDEAVSLDLRIDCVSSIGRVFGRLFSRLCSEHLSHLGEKDAASLNEVCYMWWDLIRDVWPEPCEITKTAIDVMQATLKLNSLACQESALHGLGHWGRFYPDEVAAIIDRYLIENPNIRPELKNYALNAREGHIL